MLYVKPKYTVSPKKTRYQSLVYIFAKFCPILEILSLLHFTRDLH